MKQTQYILIGTLFSLVVIYAVFWSYVHFGSKKVKEINPSDWTMKNRETVQRPAIPLQGPGNFRDIGKIYIDSQRFVTTGVLFRSDSPSKFTESDWKMLKELGITLIIDLRSEKEAEGDPYRPIDGIRHIRNPVYNDDPIRSVISHILFHRSKLNDMMAKAYIRMIHERAKSFGQSIRLLADNLDHGTVIHCTAGKDRTGLMTAMILELLGVDRKTTLYDYSLSNNGFESNYKAFLENDAPKLEKIGVPPEELKVLFMANPQWLEDALNDITIQYGNMENYLIQAAGVDKESIERLKGALIRRNKS